MSTDSEQNFINFVDRQRDRSMEVIADNSRGRDNLLLTLSAGAFTVSVAFFAVLPKFFIYPQLLFLAWIILGASLILQLINYECGIHNALGNVKFVNDNINTITKPEWDKQAKSKKTIQTIMETINASIIGSTIVGVVIMVMFSVVNIAQIIVVNQNKLELQKETLLSALINDKGISIEQKKLIIDLINQN